MIALTTDVGAWKSTVVEPFCILARTIRLSEELPVAVDRIVSDEVSVEQDPWRIELNSRDFKFSAAA